ncbi:MoaD/ThiS family protein [Parapedobacter sp.]
MTINVLTFGSVTEILEKEFNAQAPDTDTLVALLIEKNSELANRKLLLAVNHTIIQENTLLKEHDVVAIMPPYSGG